MHFACPVARLHRYAKHCGQVQWENMFYYTYVLRSKIDNNLYIGWTIDINSRVREHNKGWVVATEKRRPLELVYFEACLSKKSAIAREKQLKTGFGRAYLNRRV